MGPSFPSRRLELNPQQNSPAQPSPLFENKITSSQGLKWEKFHQSLPLPATRLSPLPDTQSLVHVPGCLCLSRDTAWAAETAVESDRPAPEAKSSHLLTHPWRKGHVKTASQKDCTRNQIGQKLDLRLIASRTVFGRGSGSQPRDAGPPHIFRPAGLDCTVPVALPLPGQVSLTAERHRSFCLRGLMSEPSCTQMKMVTWGKACGLKALFLFQNLCVQFLFLGSMGFAWAVQTGSGSEPLSGCCPASVGPEQVPSLS
ncbi:PREDICTED: uncharacterized protein LOC102250349 [Myotis brandtii]|uniref:uncharacterized protein LOC102250349 n=1 Tax=Myotis brandtii TaxID=109478 RepID=UPI0003BB9F12|nr:PREDICTED: uncharacterized protein LOC102250349 [Myotis brandtii]